MVGVAADNDNDQVQRYQDARDVGAFWRMAFAQTHRSHRGVLNLGGLNSNFFLLIDETRNLHLQSYSAEKLQVGPIRLERCQLILGATGHLHTESRRVSHK